MSIARFALALAVPAAALPAVALPAAALLAPASHASTASFGSLAVTRAATADYSPNWGGYVASGTTFRYVRATFTVPALDCAKTPGSASDPALVGEWVGLDEVTVEQDGISGQCSDKHAQYSAWYEMFPKKPVYPGISIHAGDEVQVSVWYVASKHEYELILDDVTDRRGFDKWERCGAHSCADSTAEVITESPGKSVATNSGYFPLADCGVTSFWNIALTSAAGQHGAFTSSGWQTTRYVMADSSGRLKAAISGLTDNGTAFKTYWEHES